jgi:Nucleosome binding factor SPN, SPT16 subunit
MQEKLQSPHTAGYVGALASIALSESGCLHFPKVYGVYTAIATKHTIDISDDYEDLSEKRWFADNLGKTFDLRLRQVPETPNGFTHTRGQRDAVVLGDDVLLDDFEDVDAEHVSQPTNQDASESVHSDSESEYAGADESSDDSSEDDFDIRSCDCSDDEEDDEGDEGDEEEPFAWATFKDVPVITTVMEKCEGTFYDLLEAHRDNPVAHAAWVAQMVFALAYAQRNYGLVHNDLHGNNVMYVKTDREFLYYKHNGTCYKVPTFGVLIKIIDFDRATMSLRLTGMKEPRFFHVQPVSAGR